MDLTERTRDFALGIIRLSTALPSNRAADVVARQLICAGISPGAHFREALRARSKAEHVAKLNGGLMELEEARGAYRRSERADRDFRIADPEMEEPLAARHFCLLLSDLK